MITYSRYNEPFADRIILSRIREARAKLPNAVLHTNTNGDYLNPDYLAEIYDAGMRSMNIQFYLKNEERYDHDAIRRRGEQTAARLKLPHRIVRDEPQVWFEYAFEFRDMAIRGYGRNFDVNGTSRGDMVDIKRDYVRTAPCLMPFWSVYFDFNGLMVPCCNFRSDIPEHATYVVGNINEEPNIFLNYASQQAVRFRRSLLNVQPKDGLCRNCHFVLDAPNDAEVSEMELLLLAAVDRY
jgi:MoaA/NifB/PqqE/SkfB family radical SAM enzyme